MRQAVATHRATAQRVRTGRAAFAGRREPVSRWRRRDRARVRPAAIPDRTAWRPCAADDAQPGTEGGVVA